MKSLEELKKLRASVKDTVDLRNQKNGFRVMVGMATCGIASGAREILNKFVEEVKSNDLNDVMVTQVGCIGECQFEPIAEILGADGKKITYCNLTDAKVSEIVQSHLIKNEAVDKYTLSATKK